MRPRRIIGILERRLLGASMSVVLFIVERRLRRRAKDRDAAQHTADERRGAGGVPPPRVRS